ncbi:MAG: short-chain dehydrogenase [Acidimicrobiia bacterium]
MLLEGKVAIVSGVGPGLGREIAVAFAAEGADVVLGARTPANLEEVAAAVEGMGRRAVWRPTDITRPEQVRELVDACIAAFGRVDVLVNNAFTPDVFQPFESVDLDAWRRIMEVNCFGSLALTRAVIPHMRAAGGGSVVFVNSMIVRKPLPLQGGYAISKAALLTAAHVLAKELGPYNIRVNSVVPGWMWGPSVEGYFRSVEERTGRSVQDQYDEVASAIPLGFMPTDEDCARAVVFLASDLAVAVTGQSLDVNGGEVFH